MMSKESEGSGSRGSLVSDTEAKAEWQAQQFQAQTSQQPRTSMTLRQRSLIRQNSKSGNMQVQVSEVQQPQPQQQQQSLGNGKTKTKNQKPTAMQPQMGFDPQLQMRLMNKVMGSSPGLAEAHLAASGRKKKQPANPKQETQLTAVQKALQRAQQRNA